MKSLRTHLVLAFVIPTALIVIGLVWVGYLSAQEGLEREVEARLEAVGTVLSSEFSEGVDAEQIQRLDESMTRVRGRLRGRLLEVQRRTAVERIILFDWDARVLVDTEGAERFGAPLYRVQVDRGIWTEAYERGVGRAAPLFEEERGQYYKTSYVPVILEGESVAMLAVIAGATYFDLLTHFATVLTLLGVLGLVLVVVVAIWFSGRIVRPVRRLVEGALRLQEGDLSTVVVVEPTGTRELDVLMASFEEMRRAIRQRDQQMQMMLAGIAHEIRNPLGGMELFCGLLREDLKASRRADDVVMVEKIERELDYLKRVVEDFLAFSTPAHFEKERVDGMVLVNEVLEVVRGEVERSGCVIKVEVEPGIELTVDVVRMRRGLINVVKNACEASREGEEVKVKLFQDEEARILEVRDQGDGMDDETLRRIEEPFFTTREQGSGLGLSLTRKIVEGHEGTVEIESEVGQGTVVRFTLPFDEAVTGREERAVEAGIPEGWLG